MIRLIARILSLLIVLLASSVSAQAESAAEIIRLKDGRTLRGQVIQHEGDRSVLFRSEDGRTLRVNLAQVDYIGPLDPPEGGAEEAAEDEAFEIVDLTEEDAAYDSEMMGDYQGYEEAGPIEGGISMSFSAPRDELSLIVRPSSARRMGRDYGWMRFCDLPCEREIRPGFYELRLQNMQTGRMIQVLGQVPMNSPAQVDFQLDVNKSKRLTNFITGGVIGGLGVGLLAYGISQLRNYCYRGRDALFYGGTCGRGAGFTAIGGSLLVVGTVFVILGATKRKNVARARLMNFNQF